MIVSKANLVSSFATGRFPTGEDFENLIDSTYNDWLTASNSHITDLYAEKVYINNTRGLTLSLQVSLFPAGSALLSFSEGSLVGMVSGL